MSVFDTSGMIDMHPEEEQDRGHLISWSDLDAFTQGYIEALFAGDIYHREGIMIYDKKLPFHTRGWAFTDLAPEALARIIADCDARKASLAALMKTRRLGKEFWEHRQHNGFVGGSYDWPSLTVQLSDDGKVTFA